MIGQKMPSRGFTIVELLIVIIVIAILAAISLVAYNGVQQRAKASALADGSVKLEKAFRLTATQEGWSTWPVYGNNPTIAALISSTEMKNYLQKTPSVPGVVDADWIYDNDADARSGCTLGTSGVNIFVANVDQATAQQVDNNIDDGILNCGKVRFTGTSFWLTIDENQTVNQ